MSDLQRNAVVAALWFLSVAVFAIAVKQTEGPDPGVLYFLGLTVASMFVIGFSGTRR